MEPVVPLVDAGADGDREDTLRSTALLLHNRSIETQNHGCVCLLPCVFSCLVAYVLWSLIADWLLFVSSRRADEVV
jgi:hypothetical protein